MLIRGGLCPPISSLTRSCCAPVGPAGAGFGSAQTAEAVFQGERQERRVRLPVDRRRDERLLLDPALRRQGGRAGEGGPGRRREFCHSDGAPCLSLMKHLLKSQGGCHHNDGLADD